jgi:hypothetical protein
VYKTQIFFKIGIPKQNDNEYVEFIRKFKRPSEWFSLNHIRLEVKRELFRDFDFEKRLKKRDFKAIQVMVYMSRWFTPWSFEQYK